MDKKLLASLATLVVSLTAALGLAAFSEAEAQSLVESVVQVIALASGGFAAARANRLRKEAKGDS